MGGVKDAHEFCRDRLPVLVSEVDPDFELVSDLDDPCGEKSDRLPGPLSNDVRAIFSLTGAGVKLRLVARRVTCLGLPVVDPVLTREPMLDSGVPGGFAEEMDDVKGVVGEPRAVLDDARDMGEDGLSDAATDMTGEVAKVDVTEGEPDEVLCAGAAVSSCRPLTMPTASLMAS